MHLLTSKLTSWSSSLHHKDPSGVEKRETTTGGIAKGQPDRDTYIIYSLPSLLLLKELFFFSLSSPYTATSPSRTSVCEDQVGKVRLQPVAGNHLTEFWRAIVWELKVGAQASLAERVQVLIHERQGEVS